MAEHGHAKGPERPGPCVIVASRPDFATGMFLEVFDRPQVRRTGAFGLLLTSRTRPPLQLTAKLSRPADNAPGSETVVSMALSRDGRVLARAVGFEIPARAILRVARDGGACDEDALFRALGFAGFEAL